MEPILKAHFTKFKQSFEISTFAPTPEEEIQNEAAAFEKFVNYVIFSLDYPEIFTADIELLNYVCAGSGNDTGIDGMGIKINDRLVRSEEEILQITKSSKKINIDFVFIQSKMRSKFDASEFNTFGIGVKHFFSEATLPENSKIKAFRKLKDFIYSDEKVISKLEKNPNVQLYYVGMGKQPTDDHFAGTVKMLEKEFLNGDFYFDEVSIKIISGKTLVNFCKELENNFSVQINILDIFPLIVDVKTEVKKAYAFTCSAAEYLRILIKEDDTLRRALFNDNVRDYLGNKGFVNSEIEKTVIENPEMFLLCNNGITIVCSDFDQVRDKLVKVENPQIVNGCQTSNSIFNLRNNPNILKTQLLIRLICTENPNVSNKIVRGTNKQNQVLEEAFEATLPFHQDILEPFFLSIENSIKIYYERRSKQYNNDALIKKTQIVNLRILTKSFVAMFMNLPQNAHRHEAKLLEEYAGEKDIRKIFREDQSPYPYYVCALTWYIFEKCFREGKIDKRYETYKSHLYLIFRESLGEYLPSFIKSKTIETYCNKLIKGLEITKFEANLPNILSVFDDTQELWTKEMGKSRFGIKDNDEFTSVLIAQCRKKFFTQKSSVIPSEIQTYEGTILNLRIEPTRWYGFIRRGFNYENVYFDGRAYKGDIKKLLPETKVRFNFNDNNGRFYATNVKIIN